MKSGTTFSSLCLLAVASAFGGSAESPLILDDEAPMVQPYADFRFRFESDWDSVNSAGIPRTDRHRLRARGRLGLKFELSDEWTADIRARTGDTESQQSPHLTFYEFDSGNSDDFSGFLDRYYLQRRTDEITYWFGRNQFPFWKTNELFWDDDVTITGAAISGDLDFLGDGFSGTAGAFYLPDGGLQLNGRMYAAQLVHERAVGGAQLTLAQGLYFLDGEPGADFLRNGNGARDYAISGTQAQIVGNVLGVPVTLGADLYANLHDYSTTDPDPFTAANANEDLGYVFSVALGELKEKGDIQIGYFYAHIETFSVNASYAEDDWERFGSPTQTDSSNFKGHEFRITYKICPKLEVMARLFDVDSLTSVEDGMRFRLDFNYRF